MDEEEEKKVEVLGSPNRGNPLVEPTFKMVDLYRTVSTPNGVIEYLFHYNILAPTRTCPGKDGHLCGRNMGLSKHGSGDGQIWRCGVRKCRKKLSLRHHSFFSRSHLPLTQLLVLVYYNFRELQMRQAAFDTGISFNSQTLVDWASFTRECMALSLMKFFRLLGGPDRVVEIDEAKWFRNKFHRGRLRKGGWVLGFVEVLDSGGTGDCLMLRVNNRKAETLIPMIKKFVRPGSRIRTDEWRAYSSLTRCGYVHATVNHSQGFANEQGDTTNAIEGLWKHARFFFPIGGTRIEYLNSYLLAFCWKKKFGNKYEGWQTFLNHMALVYNPYRRDGNRYLEEGVAWEWYWHPPGTDPELEGDDEEEEEEEVKAEDDEISSSDDSEWEG